MDKITKPLDREVHIAFMKSKDARLLSTIPGVGELTAVSLAAFLCPIERFSSLEGAVKYCGLCPSLHQSGNVSHTGHLVWDCNPLLKWVLIEAQWSTRRYEKKGDVARIGKRVARRGNKNDGAVAAARKLLRICVAVLRRGTPYQTQAPPSSSRPVLHNSR
jgi:transposase